MLPFELDRLHHPVPRVLAGRVMKHLDVVEHAPASFNRLPIAPAPDAFALEQVKETLGYCVVRLVAVSAHRRLLIAALKEWCPITLVNCERWSEWVGTRFFAMRPLAS